MHQVTTPFLASLEGSEITTDADPYFSLPAQTWIITQHLEESALLMSQNEVARHGPVSTMAKFLCYRKDDVTQKPAFMRIHRQIPTIGTEYSKPEIRALQAVPMYTPTELKAFQKLKSMACNVTPALLGYKEAQQDNDEAVPGGFSVYIVWDKVPGESLSDEYFWSLDRDARDTIRREFRRFLPCGIEPTPPTTTNLIYDQTWSDTRYVLYCLANPSRKMDWALDSSEWEF
ncbi:uncharacterized protein N7525_009521 [Penicillium rubens]|uniref:uncharacterized protein n=1 Tax=Penicillium rubens TaxID=1108849 RepID=UPI002A5AA97B|nr:uncharacterized protein N7525_009521 [Penicillium rubens]KAJ5831268.1 hypothetical protein N7525_009521 [Penicillium rubens]KAJ5854811.1 hypothetical protein N7534_007354 [Penicillium rubens]